MGTLFYLLVFCSLVPTLGFCLIYYLLFSSRGKISVRVAVPTSCTEVLGRCSNCGVSFDDYSSRIRCSHCRMLLLICNNCQVWHPFMNILEASKAVFPFVWVRTRRVWENVAIIWSFKNLFTEWVLGPDKLQTFLAKFSSCGLTLLSGYIYWIFLE